MFWDVSGPVSFALAEGFSDSKQGSEGRLNDEGGKSIIEYGKLGLGVGR
jgi:hypothetical protein